MKQNFEQLIETTRFLVDCSSNKKEIVAKVLSTNQVNTQFIEAFYSFITPEDFSKAFKLNKALIEGFPELFDESIFFANFDPEKASPDGLLTIIENEKEWKSVISNEAIETIIRKAEKEELTKEFVKAILGRSETLDKLLVEKTSDKNELKKIAEISKIRSRSTYGLLTAEEKTDQLISDGPIEPEELFRLLLSSDDLKWRFNGLKLAAEGKIELKKNFTFKTFSLFAELLKNFSEGRIIELAINESNLKPLFNKTVCDYLLDNIPFSEESLIAIKGLLSEVGCKIKLKRIAKLNEYNELLKELE